MALRTFSQRSSHHSVEANTLIMSRKVQVQMSKLFIICAFPFPSLGKVVTSGNSHRNALNIDELKARHPLFRTRDGHAFVSDGAAIESKM